MKIKKALIRITTSAWALILICLYINTVSAQYYPHHDSIDYREDFRGQYHFSPKSEWMNDINGLVYQGGKYHMIYQWGKSIRHGGYASSPDLMHWKDEGVALIPQKSFLPPDAVRNVSGAQVYSGSAVLVNGDVAMKITGSDKEAIVAIYTGTEQGTCLAWSNDNGKTWHDYKGNPVAHFAEKADPRDPCVIWHKPTSKWVLALYENGTTFYGSKDLITWNYLSNLDFGYECPDLYQLPLNGNEDKWVLQDANGTYLVGDFDGVSFSKDEGQDTLIMDQGPDFYAAQTFPAGNLPNNDERIIQLAWMDHWNGGIGETVWERNATFPVSLGLVSIEGQTHLTRMPIAEIADIYESSQSWGSQVIRKNENLLSEIKSKKFDLVAEIDLSKTKAKHFGIRVANKTIEYDVARKTLLSKKVIFSDKDKLQFRILVDWGQLEVFANDGVFSFTQQFAFTPGRDDLEFFADGDVQLVSLEFHEVKRTWD